MYSCLPQISAGDCIYMFLPNSLLQFLVEQVLRLASISALNQRLFPFRCRNQNFFSLFLELGLWNQKGYGELCFLEWELCLHLTTSSAKFDFVGKRHTELMNCLLGQMKSNWLLEFLHKSVITMNYMRDMQVTGSF
ncbi:unnamed protein product [Citrullus colocynthis]|uniref:Uncharacterized protein n=1 Tax=Citrullus colocynthis TaxID=252529 RepID=A0ABP0Y6I0_9ROSI